MSQKTAIEDVELALRDLMDVRSFDIQGGEQLRIIPRCPPNLFAHLELDGGIGSFSHYSSIIQKLDVFERVASEKDGRVAVALIGKKTVVGYGACWYPRSEERWSKLGDLMYEMGALEVSRNYRHLHVAGKIFDSIMEDDFFENKIAYMCGYSWHWDLEGTGLTMFEYRNMMLRLLRHHGFKEHITNEPNISLREENFFMVRVGSRVSEEDRRRFRDLRFGITWR